MSNSDAMRKLPLIDGDDEGWEERAVVGSTRHNSVMEMSRRVTAAVMIRYEYTHGCGEESTVRRGDQEHDRTFDGSGGIN